MDSRDVNRQELCPKCLGTKEQCGHCHGKGVVPVKDVVIQVDTMKIYPKQENK